MCSVSQPANSMRRRLASLLNPSFSELKPIRIVTSWQSGGLRDLACVALLMGYFLYFAVPSLRGGFSQDEMMNMYFYWQPGTAKCLWANICFWTDFYRPGGALYYLPLYHFFSLNPEPYRVAQLAIVAASIPIMYWLSRLLTESRLVAFLAAIIVCYHADLANLVFRGSYIYDAICGFFYFAALAFYLQIRERGRNLAPWEVAAFLLLYICALNAKEMAVTLPVIALIYEMLKCPSLDGWKLFIRQNWRSAVPPLVAGALTAIYIYGKTHGSGPLVQGEVYQPQFSWHTFLESNATFIAELRFDHRAISPITLLLLWVGTFIYAFIRRDRMLQLMGFWILLVPLPLAFIRPIRGGACLWLLLFGWAIIFAKVASDVIGLVWKSSRSVRQGAALWGTVGAIVRRSANHHARDTLVGAVIGALIGGCAAKLSRRNFRAVAIALLVFAIAMITRWENQRLGRIQGIFRAGQETLHAIELFRSLALQPAPDSNILIKNTFTFKNDWTPLFIASLVWNDHSLQIWVDGKNQLTAEQVANLNYVVLLTPSKAKLLRAPHSRYTQ
jgi:hypothetical protein